MSAEEQKQIAENLFAGNGETSVLLRSHDWSQTPLGEIETWSESLKTAVQSHLTDLNPNPDQRPEQVQQASVPPQNCTQTDALYESEAKYRMLFESIDEGFCVVEVLFDPAGTPCDHRILRANPAFERQTGITNPEGKTASELVPGIEQYWNDLYAQVIHTGESTRIENRSEALDRWFDVLVSRVGDEAMHQVAIVFTDISERKQAENTLQQTAAELKRQLRKLDAIAASVPDFIYTFDLSGRFTYISQSLLDLWQKPSAEATGRNFLELDYPEELAARLQNQIQQVIETRQPLKDETPYTSAVGTRAYEYIFVPMFDAAGAVEAVAGVTRDITDRKQAEAALRESEELKQSILDSSKDCIKVLTLNSEIVYITTGGLCLLEVDDPTDILNASWVDFWQGEDYESAKSAIAAATAGSTGRFQGYLSTYKGTPKWWDSIITPVRNSAGAIAQLVAVSRDITRQKQAETEREHLLAQEQAARESAERANRIKDEFLAVLSHELRSPLNPILGWTRLLQSGKLDTARQTNALKTIERNAKLQSQLIEDLLDISRIMQGKLTLTATPVSLPLVILAAIETVQLAADAKQIEILLDVDPSTQPVSGDAARLQQVVWNLLTNAVKFTSNGGQVTIELRQLNQNAQLRVIDTGKGIHSQFLPYVFEYFRQEDGSTTRRFGGLGLGLAIVWQIVELHGGTVKAESDGEEQGATFIVQLPTLRQASSIVSEPIQVEADSETHLENVQILLVDDDADTREFEAFLLEQHGATVIATASGLEALQVIDQFTPDLIVSDIGMAEIDGYMLIQQIRERSPSRGGQVPAIALTAYAAEIDHKRAIQAGFQRHLTKPLEPAQFISTIVNLLKPE